MPTTPQAPRRPEAWLRPPQQLTFHRPTPPSEEQRGGYQTGSLRHRTCPHSSAISPPMAGDRPQNRTFSAKEQHRARARHGPWSAACTTPASAMSQQPTWPPEEKRYQRAGAPTRRQQGLRASLSGSLGVLPLRACAPTQQAAQGQAKAQQRPAGRTVQGVGGRGRLPGVREAGRAADGRQHFQRGGHARLVMAWNVAQQHVAAGREIERAGFDRARRDLLYFAYRLLLRGIFRHGVVLLQDQAGRREVGLHDDQLVLHLALVHHTEADCAGWYGDDARLQRELLLGDLDSRGVAL